LFRYRRGGESEERLAELNKAIWRRLRADGRYIPSATIFRGRYAIRPCFVNPRTTIADVEEMVRSVRRIGDELTAG
jgi:aromatic-L-amino-acid decarboxylase